MAEDEELNQTESEDDTAKLLAESAETDDSLDDELWREQQSTAAIAAEANLAEAAEIDDEVILRLDYELNIQGAGTLDNQKVKTIDGISEIITRGNHFVTDGFSGELMVFIDHGRYGGTYIEATRSIEFAIFQIAKGYQETDIWTKTTKRREVYNWINKGLKTLEDPDLRHINVQNGLIFLAPGGDFISHYPDWNTEYLTTVKLPINYDPNAKCPIWEQFIRDVFPEDAQHIAWELAALLMVPLKNKAASAVILKGPKNTGKSTFQNGILSFLGEKNVSNLSIDQFGERFQDAQLKGKLANVVGEIPAIRLSPKTVNVIKKLIGNDPLSGEIKNGASFMFKSYARCLFSCNDMPTCDSDDAFFDRFHIIPFVKQFSKDPVKEAWLNEMLSSPEELSGLLNKALEVLPKVFSRGIQATESMKNELAAIVEENDPLISWFNNYVERAVDAQLLFNDAHEHYKKLEPTDKKRHSNKSFGRDLKKLLPEGIRKTQFLMEDGNRPYGFRGIRLKDQVEEQAIDQTDFIDLSFDLEQLAD